MRGSFYMSIMPYEIDAFVALGLEESPEVLRGRTV